MARFLLTLVGAAFVLNLSHGCSLDEAKAKLNEPIWLEGPVAATRDDAISEVKCPEGYYVKRCFLSVDVKSDGAKIVDSRTCQAVNTGVNTLTDLKAVVQCQPKLSMNVITVLHNVMAQNTAVTSPEGYVLDDCVGNNPWSYRGVFTMIRGANHCGWRKLSGSNISFMKISLTCIKA